MYRRIAAAVAGVVIVLCAQGAAANKPWIHFHSQEADNWSAREHLEARKQARYRVTWRDARWRQDPVVRIKLLGINDFHGQLSPRSVGGRLAGGAAVLAAYLEAAAAAAEDGALIVHAGDHVGASPPSSALLQDEPSISFLNTLANRHCRYRDDVFGERSKRLPEPIREYLEPFTQPYCNVVGTFGNHEFDEGIDEALRLVNGGAHPHGPFLEPVWRGAKFPYVLANVVDEDSGRTVVPAFTVKYFGRVAVGVIGAVLKETPTIVTPTGIASLRFVDEAAAINQAVRKLERSGVDTIVVTIHQGIRQTSYEGSTDPEVTGLSGPIVDIVAQLDDAVDVVISGHAHGFTNALVANASGKEMLVVQAFSASTAYDDIDLAISRRSGDVVEKSASIVTTWVDEGPGLSPNAEVAALVAAADRTVEPLVNQVVGSTTTEITRTEAPSGESALGNLIADAQRIDTGADFAFMNPGGIRADLDAGDITWGELFTIQPFSNDLVSMDLTGAQIETLLEQQWLGQPFARILKTSGLSYTWDATAADGSRIVAILDAGGTPLDPATTYRVTVNSFMAAGGDNFTVLPDGTNRVVGRVDLDALVDYIGSLPQPIGAGIEGRITVVD